MLDKVSVLGTEYEIDITEIKNDETDGYVSFPDKKIFIMNLDHHEHNATQVRNRVIRHELVHAFLHESGLETGCEWAGNEEVEGVTLIRERLGIASVNDGKNYIDDIKLIKQFGIIEREMDWPEIDEKTTLKSRGDQYMDGQRAILTTWEVEVVEKSLIDDRFKKFKVGNTHPIDNPPMAGIEELQIIEKRTDFLTPHRVGLVIGADKQTLSSYSLQVQEAQKSIQNVRRENNQLKRQLETQLTTLQLQLADLLGSEGNEGTIAELQRQIQEILDQMEGGV